MDAESGLKRVKRIMKDHLVSGPEAMPGRTRPPIATAQKNSRPSRGNINQRKAGKKYR